MSANAQAYRAELYSFPTRVRRPRGDAISLLALPYDFDPALLPGRAATCEERPPDAIVLWGPNAASLIAQRLSPPLAAILPVVVATRDSGRTSDRRRADLIVGPPSRSSLEDAVALLEPFVERVRALPPSVVSSADPRVWLLARLFVRGRGLEPQRDPAVRETYWRPDEAAIPGAAALAGGLVDLGLMERRFFDRTLACPHCQSARLSARELCISCCSADLIEQPIIHHMRCAYQAPESDFRRDGHNLSCPKCRGRLQHFGVDYDRPGSLHVCATCGCASGDASVSFVCLDCEADIPAAHVASRTVHAYALTAQGSAAVASGATLPSEAAHRRGFADRVRDFVKRQAELKRAGAVFVVRMREPVGVPAASPQWAETCAFFGELMRECFIEDVEIIKAPFGYVALLPDEAKADVVGALLEIRSRLEQPLALQPRIDYAVYDSADVLALSSRIKAVG